MLDNSPAQKAGLAAGDVIIALNGIKANISNIEKLIAPYSTEDTIEIHAFRRDELMQFHLTPEPAPQTTCAMKLLDNANTNQTKARSNWLKIK